MYGLFGASGSVPRRLSRWLLPFRSRGGESADNPDGWGVAFWSGGHPNIEKSPEPGWSSAHFLQLVENLASNLVIAHVRKARHPPVPSLENTHPFVIAYVLSVALAALIAAIGIERQSRRMAMAA